jgi:hypothetical protein
MLRQNRTDDIATDSISMAELTALPQTFERASSHVQPGLTGLPAHIRFQGEMPKHQDNEF